MKLLTFIDLLQRGGAGNATGDKSLFKLQQTGRQLAAYLAACAEENSDEAAEASLEANTALEAEKVAGEADKAAGEAAEPAAEAGEAASEADKAAGEADKAAGEAAEPAAEAREAASEADKAAGEADKAAGEAALDAADAAEKAAAAANDVSAADKAAGEAVGPAAEAGEAEQGVADAAEEAAEAAEAAGAAGPLPEADLLCLMLPEFVEGYARYLYKLNPQQSVLGVWLENLHRVARAAIRGGFMPAVDVFPQVRRRLCREGLFADIPGEGYRIKTHDFKANIQHLMQTLSAASLDFRQSPTRWNRNSAILHYVIALELGGADFMALVRAARGQGSGDADADADDPRLAKLLGLHNGVRYKGSLLLNLSAWTQKTSPEEMRNRLDSDISAFLARYDIRLYASHSVFSDYLGLRVQTGLPEADAIALARQHLRGHRPLQLQPVREATLDYDGVFMPQWRVLCSYRPGEMGHRLAERVRRLEMGGVATYAPVRTEQRRQGKKMVTTQRACLGRYLFVSSTAREATRLEAELSDAAFLRDAADRRRPAVVSDREVQRLRLFLRDYADEDVALVDADDWLREHADGLGPGSRVRIASGAFAGYEGTVVSRKDAGEPTVRFMVRLEAASNLAVAANVSLALTPFDLEPLG